VGPGASVRYVLRFMLPVVAVLLLFLLIPGPIWVPLAMMALLLLPLLYFAVALMNIYRRHRLLSHGLDPDLLTAKAQRRADRTREDYEKRHGRGVE
jgi:membrane protein YdbS with pleckstrin-like domain